MKTPEEIEREMIEEEVNGQFYPTRTAIIRRVYYAVLAEIEKEKCIKPVDLNKIIGSIPDLDCEKK
jgi:hypothetical protein